MEKQLRRIRWLTNEELERVHQYSLDILWERGMRVTHPEAVELLTASGARYDKETKMVHYPQDLVERCIELVPRKIVLGGRLFEKDVILTPETGPFARSLGACERYVDVLTRVQRIARLDDVKEFSQLTDALENIHIGCAGIPNDVPIEMRDFLITRTYFENSTKPFMINLDSQLQTKAIIDLALALRGSREELRKRPPISILISTTSPATIIDPVVDIILLCAQSGIPMELNATPLMGGTGPVTLAGIILSINLEILSLIVLAQLSHPGSPVIYRSIPVGLNMSNGSMVTGAPENDLGHATLAQLASEKYKFFPSVFGMGTDSMLADAQCQMERTVATILSAHSGASILAGAGMLNQGNILDPVQLTIDDQLLDYVYRTLQGFVIDDETLAKDVLMAIKPGDEFISLDHTLKYFRTEHILPKCLNRNDRDTWEAEGGKDMEKLASERAIDLLGKHQVIPVANEVKKDFEEITKQLAKVSKVT